MTLLGPDVGITDLLDYEITEKLKAEQEERKGGKIKYHPLRPSSAGHCSRKLALELMEYRGKAFYGKPLLEPSVYRLFELGHSVEFAALRSFQLVKIFEQKYKQQSMSIFELERGAPGLEKEIMEGSCDFVLFSKKWRCIGDVKSKKDGFSSYVRTKWDEELEKFSGFKSLTKISSTAFYATNLSNLIAELGDDWLVDNLLQLNLYAMSPFMREREIDFAFLYRYNKNDSRHMELRFRPSGEVFDLVEAKFNRINKAVDTDQLPEACEFPIGSIRHAYCDCHLMLPYAATDPVRAFYQTCGSKVWPKDAKDLRRASELKSLYKGFKGCENYLKKREKAEAKIIEICTEEKISKVKFEDGHIYQIKLLKSPREHFELRRTKL